jgi:uncharacterized protein YbjT (DUF2867 family)
MFLIIGANGQIGSQLTKQLLSEKQSVRALVRDTKKAPKLDGVEVVQGDVANVASLEKALQGVSAVFVLTAGEAILDEKNVFAAAKTAGAHVVLLSTMGAQTGSPIRLGDMHGQSEDALKASGASFTILQPTMFMSNVLGSLGTIKSEGKFYGAMQKGRVPLIDTADIAATAAAVLKAPKDHAGKTLSLTGPEGLSQADLADRITKVAGKPVAYVDIPVDAFVGALKGAGLPDWLADDFGKMHAWFGTDAAATPSGDVQRVTGRAPRSFDAWLADNAAAFRA